MRGGTKGINNKCRAMMFAEGWKECRSCKRFVQTKERFCDECGQTLATTPRTGKGKRHLHRLLGIKRY